VIDDESDNAEQHSGTSDQAVSQGEERTGTTAGWALFHRVESGWSLVRESGDETSRKAGCGKSARPV
jgi:hypothetical protein